MRYAATALVFVLMLFVTLLHGGTAFTVIMILVDKGIGFGIIFFVAVSGWAFFALSCLTTIFWFFELRRLHTSEAA